MNPTNFEGGAGTRPMLRGHEPMPDVPEHDLKGLVADYRLARKERAELEERIEEIDSQMRVLYQQIQQKLQQIQDDVNGEA